ncbi:MAG: S24 family peptidase [Alphaproteobacteria bacterium]|nr:S24 family peptidase [Alphaproteobacteria bacterium]
MALTLTRPFPASLSAMNKISPSRLQARLDALSLTARAVSMAVARQPNLVRMILNGTQRDTATQKAHRLAVALECSLEYLYEIEDEVGSPPESVKLLQPVTKGRARTPKAFTVVKPPRPPVDRGERIDVPEYDVRLSAGDGALITEENVRRFWGLPLAFLESMGLDAAHIAFVEIAGDSMAPTLLPGDLVLLDLRSRNPSLPAIYAVWDSNATVCKRLQAVPMSDPPTVRLISDNERYGAYEVPAEWVNVIGRVAWFSRRI